MSKMNNTGNTKHNDNHVLKWLMLVLTCIFQLSPIGVKAQLVPRDIPTIEAYINDHKKQRSLLLARSTLEESNKLLHQASKVTHREYRDVNLELDKYTKAFDVIDLVYNTVSTGFNVYRTYDTVSDKSRSTSRCCRTSMKKLSNESVSKLQTPSCLPLTSEP